MFLGINMFWALLRLILARAARLQMPGFCPEGGGGKCWSSDLIGAFNTTLMQEEYTEVPLQGTFSQMRQQQLLK